jgi:hypothetical protein
MTGDIGLALSIWMCPCGNNVHHTGTGVKPKSWRCHWCLVIYYCSYSAVTLSYDIWYFADKVSELIIVVFW